MLSLKEKTKEQLALSGDVRVIRVIEKIFNFAIGCEADEIYFESSGKDLAVDFRAGGELKKSFRLPKKIEAAVMAGIKEMAGLDYLRDDSPEKGNFKKDYLGYKIIFSLSVHPTEAGEKIVVGLAKERFELPGLGRLGFNLAALAKVKAKLAAGAGLIAVIGEDDSGRIAALYSLIDFLNCPELNIATVEKDVAADLPEINQSRINPRAGFSSGAAVNALRRQDADAVMIGEVNDPETAEAAFHLAAAGHLVLVGINRRDLTGALELLRDLGLPLAVFSVNTGLLIVERRADRNCPYCLGRQKVSRENLRWLEENLSLAGLLPRLQRDNIIAKKIAAAEDLVFYKSRGCARCRNSGQNGKIGIFEVREITPAVKELIKTGHFSALKGELKKQDGYSLAEDALIKALSGIISIEAVFSVFD